MRVGREESELFRMRVGLRQGCVMSPCVVQFVHGRGGEKDKRKVNGTWCRDAECR